jgi:hypothetical protein
MEEPLNPAGKATVFLNGIMRQEHDDGENGSKFFPLMCGKGNLYISRHRFILHILMVITLAWRKTN